MRTLHLTLLIGLWAGAAAGCAHWSLTEAQDSSPPRLPAPQMSRDSVVLELAFVRMPVADAAAYDEIWSAADEQQLSADLRRVLSENGLRCGVLGQQLPEALRVQLEKAKSQTLEDRSEDVDTSETEIDTKQRRMQCRAGRRAKIIVSKTYEDLSLLTREGNAVRGKPLSKAQCLFALKPYPESDGRVRLDLTPVVEHGDVKQQWVGQSGALMQRMSKERVVLDTLRINTPLEPGQVLVVSTTADVCGLGEHFFTETAGGTSERLLLLLRVAQTQHDGLFAPETVADPLATPAD